MERITGRWSITTLRKKKVKYVFSFFADRWLIEQYTSDSKQANQQCFWQLLFGRRYEKWFAKTLRSQKRYGKVFSKIIFVSFRIKICASLGNQWMSFVVPWSFYSNQVLFDIFYNLCSGSKVTLRLDSKLTLCRSGLIGQMPEITERGMT